MAMHSSIFLPGESHAQRSPVGYRPRGGKESDTAEQLHFHFHFKTLYHLSCEVIGDPESLIP